MMKRITWFSGWSKKKWMFFLLFLLILAAGGSALAVMHARREEQRLITKQGSIKIACLGDSIWDICRDDTGIAALTAQRLQAEVINLGIMGTTAAYRGPETDDAPLWNSKSLLSVASALTNTDSLLPEKERQRLGIDQTDFGNVDYFLIAYGLNDYFSAVPREGEDPYDTYTYAGALRTAVEMLREAYPEAAVVILSQTYCQGYSYGKVDSESDWKDYGGGTGPEYVETARKVADEYGLLFVDNYKEMGINIHNGTKYLNDATHLSEKGREKYANILAEHILQDFRKTEKTP